MIPRAGYRERAPRAELRPFVDCVWSFEAGDEAMEHVVLPDGCVDLLSVAGRAPVVVGTATTADRVVLPARASLIGVRFRAGAAPALLGVPAVELTDQHVALDAVWSGPEARALDEGLASGEGGRAEALEAALIARLGRSREVDAVVLRGVSWLTRNLGAPVRALAHALDLSERQVLRRFERAVGYGPKTLQRVLRLHSVLAAAGEPARSSDRAGRPRLAELAARAGFVDQPHMARELRELAGATPTELLLAPYVTGTWREALG